MEKILIARDAQWYLAWPDVALCPSGKLVCVFSACTHHGDRSYTQIMLSDSSDRGRSWSSPRALSESSAGRDYFYNCPRIKQLKDGRLCVIVDRVPRRNPEGGSSEKNVNHLAEVLLYFSSDEGQGWSEAQNTSVRGIVPDKIVELASGRWLLASQYYVDGFLVQFVSYSDDNGRSWQGPIVAGKREGLNLCEASIIPVRDKLICFMRENSGQGWDCFKSISADEGESWSEPIAFPLPGCHRPVAGHLQDGRIMITYRFMQGGKGWLGTWTQNFFAAVTDDDSALARERKGAATRIMPIDYDRSGQSDLGYSGWVQFPDGEIFVVNYIVDDAPRGQIRGYAFRPEEFGG
jgi:hypothetical protein